MEEGWSAAPPPVFRPAPLASMEDLSQTGTPLGTPRPSPRPRHRWSHRSSLGVILDCKEEEECDEERIVEEEEEEEEEGCGDAGCRLLAVLPPAATIVAQPNNGTTPGNKISFQSAGANIGAAEGEFLCNNMTRRH